MTPEKVAPPLSVRAAVLLSVSLFIYWPPSRDECRISLFARVRGGVSELCQWM